jgi:hypothetical protein
MSTPQRTMTDTFKTESQGALLAGDRYLALLAIVLLGYALLGKGFAYLGFPPLYVGEIAFLSGIVVFLRTGAFVGALATLPAVLLIVLMAWVLARTFPFIGLRHRHLWQLCLHRHWSVARGCAPDQHRASLLRDHAGDLSCHVRGVIAHEVLGR